MFSANSRYAKAGTYSVRISGAVTVTVTRMPLRPRPALQGFHARNDTQRLDLIAAHYLGDATAFWQLCDAGEALAPDALAARRLVAIPKKDR